MYRAAHIETSIFIERLPSSYFSDANFNVSGQTGSLADGVKVKIADKFCPPKKVSELMNSIQASKELQKCLLIKEFKAFTIYMKLRQNISVQGNKDLVPSASVGTNEVLSKKNSRLSLILMP